MRQAAIIRGMFVARGRESKRAKAQEKKVNKAGEWNPEDFGREQIRGLVRQVFLSQVERPVRQVVFSAADRDIDVRELCRQVGEALALETQQRTAVVGVCPQGLLDDDKYPGMKDLLAGDRLSGRAREATPAGNNLWLVPFPANEDDQVNTTRLHSYLSEMRTRFEYSIVVAPPATVSDAATAMAQLADGIVLVLSAHHTRRITARKIKEKLEAAAACLLGTVLSDRTFPIPEGIYRRL